MKQSTTKLMTNKNKLWNELQLQLCDVLDVVIRKRGPPDEETSDWHDKAMIGQLDNQLKRDNTRQ